MQHVTISQRVIMAVTGLASLLLLSTTANARQLDFNLTDDAIRVAFSTNISKAGQTSQRAGVKLGAGYLYIDGEGDEDSSGLFHADLLAIGDAGAPSGEVIASIGGRAYYVNEDSVDGGALGVGGGVRVSFAGLNRLAFSATVFYAPDLLSFGDVEQFLELGLRAEYEILQSAWVYLGYRNINADFDVVDDVTVDTGATLGMTFEF